MKRFLMIFISAILSGACITFGATTFVLCNNGEFISKFAGAFMFCIGLYTIIHFNLWLYTGKVGYVLDNKPKYILEVLTCFIGNVVGGFLLSSLIAQTSIIDILRERCQQLVEIKLNSSWYSILIMSMLCGVMIYLSVEGHKRAKYNLAKTIFAFMPIMLFILCGFEHVIANVTYFTYAGVFSAKALLYFFLMFIGNALGSILFALLLKVIEKLNENKNENIEVKEEN
jgi:formate/nitrite transporter FocA (FNT family)